MIIDFHTHTYPEKIRIKAVSSMNSAKSNSMFSDGSIDGLLKNMDDAGFDIAVSLGLASAKSQTSVNDYAISINSGRIVAFGSVHPDAPAVFEELHRLKEAGIKGLKFHPDFQGIIVDEDRMLKIYEKASSMGFISVFHTGKYLNTTSLYSATPEIMSHILDAFSAPVIAAHMGGNLMYSDSEKYLVGKNIFFDTSNSHRNLMTHEQLKRMVYDHGHDKILFSTDSPWNSLSSERDYILSAGFEKEISDAIFFKNAQRILKLGEISNR